MVARDSTLNVTVTAVPLIAVFAAWEYAAISFEGAVLVYLGIIAFEIATFPEP